MSSVKLYDGYGITYFYILGCLIVSTQFAYIIYTQNKYEEAAINGDEKSAMNIILPCYKDLFRFYIYLYLIFSLILIILLASSTDTILVRFAALQYFTYLELVINTYIPALFLKQYVSLQSFYTTARFLSPWWLICTILWIISVSITNSNEFPVLVLFLIFSSGLPLLLVTGLLLKYIPSRVSVDDKAFRSSLIYLLVYTLIYIFANIVYDVFGVGQGGNNNIEATKIIGYVFVATSFTWNILFPVYLLPTLRSDTHYWRGIGRSAGIDSNDDLLPVNMQTASNQLQDMMTRVKHFVVDFAYLKTGRKIGDGASARVYEGVYRGNKVAIKVSTPNELSDEVMEAFATETKIMIGLEHKNVVKFYGICVKPPQIGLVVELCPKGDLKSSLMSEPKYWTFNRKLRAALECASGLAYLHDNKIIHRDIKINNFFITENYSIKLGDFGESTLRRDTENRRMTILGTVSYMSPELVAADKNYTSAVDIYALGITLCEIFSGETPFAKVNNFLKIYESITKGDRPDLPKDIPIELKNIIEVHFCFC